jgi:hypothetical protein
MLSLCSLAMLLLVNCAQESNIVSDEAAIQAVIETQIQAMNEMNYDMQADIWAHAPYIERWGKTGWDAISDHYQNLFSDESGFEVISFEATNYEIYVNGTFASVFHDETHEYMRNGEKVVRNARTHKYLEKINGQWKVIALF